MPTPQLREHLRTLRRDARTLVPCNHPECAAYRLSLIEQIGIVVHLLATVPQDSSGKRPQSTGGARDKGVRCPRKGGVSPSVNIKKTRGKWE